VSGHATIYDVATEAGLLHTLIGRMRHTTTARRHMLTLDLVHRGTS
jgi:hypothetical protein